MSRLRRAAVLGLVVGIFGGVLYWTQLGATLEQSDGLSWLFKMRGPRQPSEDVVVVSIDKNPRNLLDVLPKTPYWQNCLREVSETPTQIWPRCVHARLIDELVARGAAVIAFDVFFDGMTRAEHDSALAEAIARAHRAVLLEWVHSTLLDENSTIEGNALISPFEPLAVASKGLAPFPLPARPARADRFWTFKSDLGDVPTLPVVTLQVRALSLLDALLACTKHVSGLWPASLPQDRESVRTADDLREVMRGLRRAFTSNAKPRNCARGALSTRMGQQQLPNETNNVLLSGRPNILSALIKMYSGRDAPFINYYGPSRTIPTIRGHWILASPATGTRTDHASVKGKVVFVGASRDRYPTPYTEGLDDWTSGVEIAATGFANLLNDDAITQLDGLEALGLLMLFGCLVGGIAYRLRVVGAALAASGLGIAYFGSAQFLFTQYNLWIPIVTPIFFQIPAGIFLAVIVKNIAPRFKIFDGVCLATDVQGFMLLASKLSAAELKSLTWEYFERLRKPIERRGGEVSHAGDDSSMNFWKTPRLRANGCLRACLAALEIQEAVHELSERQGSPALPTRIGLHAGRIALAGLQIRETVFTNLMHDVPNTASRVQELNKHLRTWILATEPVVRHLDSRLLLRRIATFRLVGRPHPVTIYEIMGRKSTAPAGQFDLCDKYGRALRLFEAERWSEATEAFSKILSIEPDDGPSRFMLEQCRQSPPNGPIIEMEEK